MTVVHKTVVDFTAATYCDKGGELFQLTTCVRVGAGAYVAGPAYGQERVAAFQRWLLPERGWMISVPLLHPGSQPFPWDWYIDLVGIDSASDRWTIDDHFIDVTVFEGDRYEVLDLDEFADALDARSLSSDSGAATLRSTQRLCAELEELNFSVPSLLARHTPDLPSVQPWDTVTRNR